MLNKKGFTLSEVMVALGVLGVLAAMLIPAIMNNAPDNDKVMFKKAYSSLERSVEELINDDTNYPQLGTGAGCKAGVPSVDVNCGFHTTTYTVGQVIPTAGENKFCYLLADKLNTVGEVKCKTSEVDQNQANWNFTTTDGIFWKIYLLSDFPLDNAVYGVRVVVDTNGDKAPNCSNTGTQLAQIGEGCDANENPDQHEIGIRYDGKIQVDPGDTEAIDILTNPTDNRKD